jgi:Spy/CpxP family protein refolding chaperone
MIRRSHVITLTALVAVLLGFTLALAQGPGFGGPRGRGAGPGDFGAAPLLRGVNLTDAQQQQVRQLAGQMREQSRPVVEEVRKAEQARRDAMEAVPLDEGRIRSAMQQLGQAQTELTVLQARFQSDVYALLTPEQQEQVQKLRTEREARLKERQDRLQQRLQQRRPQA